MVPEGGVAREALLADVARVRSLAGVDALVVLEVRPLAELLAARAALERFLARVHALVVLEVGLLGEGRVALVASVRLVARVQPLVAPQRRVPRERVVAQGAVEWLVISAKKSTSIFKCANGLVDHF